MKFLMNKCTKNIDISQYDKWLYTQWNLLWSSVQSLIRYFTLSLNDSIICEIFHEQARKLPKIFDYFLILSIRSFILSLMFWQLFIRWASLFLLGAVLSSNYFIIWPVWLDFNDVAYACPIVLSLARWLVFFNRLFPAMSPGSF